MQPRIESVAIVGGDIVGWSVAAAMKRRLPYLNVTVIPASGTDEDPANRLISTLPSIAGFHEDIGLTEADTVARAASSLRLGSRFDGWVDGLPAYIHAYGPYGQPLNGAPFHQLWLREQERGGVEAFHRFSLQAELGDQDRVVDPKDPAGKDLQYGLQIDRELYLSMITAYAQHIGVGREVSSFEGCRVRGADGFVEAVIVEDGRDVVADLFIDCSGPGASLLSHLDDAFEDWGGWLLSDRLLIATDQPDPQLPAIDEVRATDIGWTWRASSPRSTSVGLAYSSAHCASGSPEQHLPESARAEPAIKLRQGRRPVSWLRNCVAVGAAAVSVEPLEWTNLHLVHSAVDRIIAMMPGRDCAEIELSEYNRQCSDEAKRIRDFICLHYILAKRDEPFWKAASDSQPPDSLAHTLALFRERGRLPFYEEETFARDSWLAVLFGQGEFPRRVDPLADMIDPDTGRLAMSRWREMIANKVPTLPSHQAYLQNFYRQAVR
jgi:tryptophan 7-halogenase